MSRPVRNPLGALGYTPVDWRPTPPAAAPTPITQAAQAQATAERVAADPLGLHQPPADPDSHVLTPGAVALRSPQSRPSSSRQASATTGPITVAEGLTRVEAVLLRLERVGILQLVAQGVGVITGLTDVMAGSVIGAQTTYQKFWKNNSDHAVAVQLFASEWTLPGEGLKIAFTSAGADQSLADIIGNSSNDRSESRVLIIAAQQSVWVAARDSGTSAIQAGTIIRGRLFDPLTFLGG